MTNLDSALAELNLAPDGTRQLRVSSAFEEGALKIALSGSGEMPDQQPLTDVLQKTHGLAQRSKVPRVVVDFDALKFMNSSCFKAFVTWLSQITALPREAAYKVHFKLNPQRRWQRVSVSALACFAVELITFEMNAPEPNTPFVDLSFSPSIKLVPMVRQFASDFYSEQLGSSDTVSRIELATHEILENAVKYSIDGMTRIRIEYRPGGVPGAAGKVVIQTWNRPRPEHLEVLRKNMDELTQASDPMAHYLELIRRTSTRTDGSGLGLGRIRAEAEMVVTYQVEGEWVRVSAEAPFTGSL